MVLFGGFRVFRFVCFGVFVCLSGLGLGFVAVIAILSEKEVVDALILSLMEWEGQ